MLRRCLLLAAVAAFLTPAAALAASSNVATTHSYIDANYALAKAAVARIGAAQAQIKQFNARLERECPGEGAGSREDEATEPVSYEVAVALVSLAYRTDAGPIAAFVGQAERLHWSNPRITRDAQRYASALHAYATLPLPDLCADVGTFKASGFQTTPAATERSVMREQAIEATSIPAGLLAPYERGTDTSVLARTEALELKLEGSEFSLGQGDWYELLQTLELQP